VLGSARCACDSWSKMMKSKSRIDFAMFTFSRSSGIDDTMITLAHDAGRDIRGVLDNRQANQAWAATKGLVGVGVKLWTATPKNGLRKLHHKLMVIDEQVVIAGSFNYTGPATQLNDENIIILGDLETTKKPSIKAQKKLAKYAFGRDRSDHHEVREASEEGVRCARRCETSMPMRLLVAVLVAVVPLIASACGPTIGKESIAVNRTVHENISDVRTKHAALVNAFFDLKREAFDAWFLETYEPAYQTNYATEWARLNGGQVFDLTTPAHRRQYVQDVIAEYEEFITEIDAIEQELLAALNTAYTDVLAANEAVTNLLVSAKAVSDAERDLWDSTVGRVFPDFTANEVERKLCEARVTALNSLTGGNATCP